jgi:hypothetical protein
MDQTVIFNTIFKENLGTIRAIRNLKKRTTNGGSRWFAAVRNLDNMYFFIIDKFFQYIPKQNAIKNMIVSKY